MPKHERKYLAFLSVNVFKSSYGSRQRLYLSNSIFSKMSITQIVLNVKKYHRICSIEFLENKELKGSSRYLHLCKFWKNFTEGNSRNCRKNRKNTKTALYLLTRYCHGDHLQKVNNNTNMIARMLLILQENFMNISHMEKKTGLPWAL